MATSGRGLVVLFAVAGIAAAVVVFVPILVDAAAGIGWAIAAVPAIVVNAVASAAVVLAPLPVERRWAMQRGLSVRGVRTVSLFADRGCAGVFIGCWIVPTVALAVAVPTLADTTRDRVTGATAVLVLGVVMVIALLAMNQVRRAPMLVWDGPSQSADDRLRRIRAASLAAPVTPLAVLVVTADHVQSTPLSWVALISAFVSALGIFVLLAVSPSARLPNQPACGSVGLGGHSGGTRREE